MNQDHKQLLIDLGVTFKEEPPHYCRGTRVILLPDQLPGQCDEPEEVVILKRVDRGEKFMYYEVSNGSDIKFKRGVCYPVSCYDEQTENWIKETFERLCKGKEYCDNFRVGRVGNVLEEMSYELRYDYGCCGYFDTEVRHPETGEMFKFGFNYGH